MRCHSVFETHSSSVFFQERWVATDSTVNFDLVADFQGDTLQVNLASGQPLATLVHGEVRAFESDYRHMLY